MRQRPSPLVLALTPVLALALTACTAKAPVGPQPLAQTPPASVAVRGTVEVELDASTRTATARVTPLAAQANSAATFTAPVFQVVNDTGPGGTNSVFIAGTFAVHANIAFSNLTLYAVSTPGDLGGTALKGLQNFGRAPLTDPDAARRVKPAQGMTSTSPVSVDSTRADMQVFTTSEANAIDSSAKALGAINAGSAVLEYGYVARNAAGGRAFALDGNGFITLSVRVPIVSAADPYRFVMTFVLADDPAVRVTQSLEEQGNNALAQARTTAVAADEVAVLPGSTLPIATAESVLLLCGPRTAGTAASPLATLSPSTVPAGRFDRTCWGTDAAGPLWAP